MELSKRLQAVTDMVTRGNRVADIGCDHGYTSIYLVENKIAPYVIAMDVNQGPLTRAQEHIEQTGYSNYIETRLSDGCEQLREGEADTLLCAGMGGRLILKILAEGWSKVAAMKECVLQPQSEIALVRKTVWEMGFCMEAEKMIYEEGKYYPMMKIILENGNKNRMPTPTEYLFGSRLLAEKNEILYQFLEKENKKCCEIAEKIGALTTSTDTNQKRLAEIKERIERISEAFSFYE